MKRTMLCVAVALVVATPCSAQFGTIGRIKDHADRAKKFADMHLSEKDERAIGEEVRRRLILELGVYEDAAVTKYVSLVGTVLAQASERPGLEWQFVVLDTDGVNAYAAPGGIIHITRGALAIIKSEAELAGVLAHEITHVTAHHAINSIKRGKALELANDEVDARGGLVTSAVSRVASLATDIVLFNEWDRGQELESDRVGLQLVNKAGYSPAGLTTFLNRLAERNQDRKEPNGLFATHPQLKERIDENARTTRDKKLGATAMVEPRYAASVKVDAVPMASITMVPRGARGAAAESTQAARPEEKKEEQKEEKKEQPKKRGFGLGSLGSALSKGQQAESTQASASAGGRMVGPDTNAVGGTNRSPVRVVITPAEIAEFKKGIA